MAGRLARVCGQSCIPDAHGTFATGAGLAEDVEEMCPGTRHVAFANVLDGFRVDHPIPERLADAEIGQTPAHFFAQLAK